MPALIENTAVEPIHVRLRQAPAISGDSVTALYDLVRRGELDLVKDEAGHSYLIYAQLKERCEKRRVVKKAAENPQLRAARDARWARHRAAKARKAKTRKR